MKNNLFRIIIKNKFFSNSLMYIIGSMVTPMVGLIMLPIYTNYLSPAEYGIMITVQTLVSMFQLFMLLSLNSAVTIFYFDYMNDIKKQKEYIGSIFTYVAIISTTLMVILLILKHPISGILFNNIPVDPYYYYLVILSWISALFALPLSLWRAQEKAWLYVTINVVQSILIMALSTYLIIVRKFGADGTLLSQLIVGIIFTIISYKISSRMISINLNRSYLKASLIFSLPLLPHVVSGWVIRSSDRVILEKYIDLSDLGLYSLAVQVSTVLSLFYVSVNNAFTPRYTKLMKNGKTEQANKLLRVFFFIILIPGILSIPVSIIGVNLLTSPEYSGSITYIPLLIIGELIKGFYFLPVAKLFFNKSTTSIATSSMVAAIISITFNFILIPYIGAYGAAISSIIAEFTRFILIFVASKRKKL